MVRGMNTKQVTPRPTARASDAQVPEPLPQKHLEEVLEGIRPTGQGLEGKAAHSPPAAATDFTHVIERTANEPRPVP